MKHSFINAALMAAALLLTSSISLSAEDKPAAPEAANPTGNAVAPGKGVKTKVPTAKIKPVDINSASKADLMKLRGIGDAEADRIIAGRPYLSKAHLVTHKVIPQGIYEQIKKQIIAVQKPEYVKQQPSAETKK